MGRSTGRSGCAAKLGGVADQSNHVGPAQASAESSIPDDLAAFGEALRDALRPIHMEHATSPIAPPGPSGAFPSRAFGLSFVVVLDASRLRDDVLGACRRQCRTTLITAANTGDHRLFAAEHVIDEVLEHAPRWCQEAGVEVDAFFARWQEEYLPVIRVVDVDDDLLEMLSPDERVRVERHRCIDPDDVPSVTLAILLQGLYLSHDALALWAVYGESLDLAVHERWLQILQDGSDARQLAEFGNLSAALSQALFTSSVAGLRRLMKATSPLILAPPLIAIAIAIARIPSESRRRLLDATTQAMRVLAETRLIQRQLSSSFVEALPADPVWEHLAQTVPSRRLLGRALLHTLARHKDSNLSAAQLAAALPYLGVAQSATTIRAVLRGEDAFYEVWRGYWQVGHAHRDLA